MPLEQFAIMPIVPVGAMVVTVAFRIASYVDQTLSSKLGKDPFSSPSSVEHCRASFVMNCISFSAIKTASFESYAISSLINSSANPIIPSPIFLFAFVIFSTSGKGYLFTSMTSSKNLTELQTASLSLPQLISQFSTNFETFIEPKLQES